MGNEEKVLAMPAEKLVSLLVAKAERKGRTEAEVYETIRVLMGYEKDSHRKLITGHFCFPLHPMTRDGKMLRELSVESG